MNQLQFSDKQLFLILATTVACTLAVFTLGLMAASLIADKPQDNSIALIGARTPTAVEPVACSDQGIPAAEPVASVQQQTEPAAKPLRYGVQIGVFEQLENAIEFVALRRDALPQARIYSRAATASKTVYPVLVGLFDNMDDAQQARHAFHERYAADSFVTDATRLQEEIVLEQTVAMLH